MKLRARVVLSLLFVVFLCFVSLNVEGFSFSSEKKKKGRDIADIPNPKTHPKECGRETVPQSSICDPDNLLTKDIKDEMEGYLNAMKEVEIAVVIISRMDLNGVTNKVSGTEKKAEVFARTLHDTWGVGDKETNKGVVLFLSTSDRVIYFSTGDGVAKTLDSQVIESLISGMRQYLRRGDYGAAIIHTLIEMDLLLTRKIRSTYGHTKDTIPRSSSSGSDESFAESAIVFLMFFGFVGFAFYMNYSRNRQISGYERGRAQLDKLMKEVDQIKDHKYACSSCPICLEDFPTPFIPATTSTFPQETVVQTTTTTVSEETMTEKSNKEEDSSSSNTRSSSESSTSSSSSEKEEERETINPPTARPVQVAEENTPSSSTSTSTSSSIPTSDSTTSTPTATATPAASNADAEKKPMALKCGHVFCRSCLEEYLTKADANNNKCPICRADIDDDPQTPNSTNTRPTSSTNTFRNRRGFFPFRRTNHIGTLWNYDSTTGTGFGTGAGLHYNQGAGTYTETSNPFHHYAPELRYRLYRIHHYYPNAVTMEVLRSMNSAIDRGAVDELRNHVVNRGAELNRMVTEIRQAAQQSSRNSGMRGSYSSSFSGGRSSGGGGGRW